MSDKISGMTWPDTALWPESAYQPCFKACRRWLVIHGPHRVILRQGWELHDERLGEWRSVPGETQVPEGEVATLWDFTDYPF